MRVGIDCRLIDKNQNTGISRYSEFLIDYYIDRFGDENIFLITNDKNYKLAKMIISNYNILHESAKFKHFPLYSESNQTDAENLTKDYFKDIEKIQEIIDKIHASILSKQFFLLELPFHQIILLGTERLHQFRT
jgi:hypothetical protein